jgi:hypothetical protein
MRLIVASLGSATTTTTCVLLIHPSLFAKRLVPLNASSVCAASELITTIAFKSIRAIRPYQSGTYDSFFFLVVYPETGKKGPYERAGSAEWTTNAFARNMAQDLKRYAAQLVRENQQLRTQLDVCLKAMRNNKGSVRPHPPVPSAAGIRRGATPPPRRIESRQIRHPPPPKSVRAVTIPPGAKPEPVAPERAPAFGKGSTRNWWQSKAAPRLFRDCAFARSVVMAPCDITLNEIAQSGYARIAHTRTLILSSKGQARSQVPVKSTISWNVLETVLSHLAASTNRACLGGHIDLLLSGDPDGNDQRVVDAATNITIDLARTCAKKQLIYIPLGAFWTTDKRIVAEAERQRGEFVCGGQCDSGHAMAILIDPRRKTREYYEPNGSSPAWYAVIAAYLDKLFAKLPEFKGYRVEDNSVCPRFGPQAGSGLPMCAYFAALYVAIRMLCPEFPAQQVMTALTEVGRDRVGDLVRRWHCYLVSYAEAQGIVAAVNELPDLHRRVFNTLINLPYNTPQQQSARDKGWEQLREVEEVAGNDVVEARDMLEQLAEGIHARSR